ncbi:hypothetical protein DYB37_011619, partial [Aphanomyces astaci]
VYVHAAAAELRMSRVQALLNRIVEYADDPNTIKTCCGVLSILSRSEDKKTEIANAGLAVILHAMNTHMANEDLLEAACDLLWTLAFNNKPVKASISTHGGIATLLRCVDVHRLNPALLRSALGTLSNLSQLVDNQQHIGAGLPVVVAAMQLHVRNVDLLAFALDTLTSIIIGHERNCRVVYELGLVDFLLDVLKDRNQHARPAVVKSTCHTLAILCELPGVGKGIADAHGIAAIIAAMSAAPLPTDVERIVTVLLFRISKDPVVMPQMIHDGVVVVLFHVLANQRANSKCSETLLATCHILCLLTQFASSHAVDLSPHLPPSVCHGDLLLRLATENASPPLALSIFRAHLSRNPVPLPALVNVSTMESMLALASFHSNPQEMLQLGLQVLVNLRRSMIAAQPLRSPDKSLAALLLAIRTFPDDVHLLDQVFCVVTSYCLSNTITTHPRTVFGFLGAAMRFLSRFSSAAGWTPQCMVEACRFLLHLMGSKDGLDSVVSCGGVSILSQFNRDVMANDAVPPPELEKLLHAMSLRLHMPFGGSEASEGEGNQPPEQQQPPDEIDEEDEDEEDVMDDDDDEDNSDIDVSAIYVDVRTSMRAALVQSDHADAQLVYQSTRPGGDAAVASAVSDAYPYAVGFPDPSRHATPPLTFDSEFDSGNLLRAVQIADTEYDLILRPDLHTQGYTQWFYFAVANTEPDVAYTFHIVNLHKPDSLFRTGLQPVVYSVQDATCRAVGWTHAGSNVCYFANPYKQPSPVPRPCTDQLTFFTLSFTLTFPHAHDTTLVAHSYPYTMHDHRWHLARPALRCPDVVRQSVLCTTLGQQACDLLTITDFGHVDGRRPVVVLTARVHPGEPQASWIMRGVLDFLVSDAPDAKLLRRLFVFKVVPMLNPDGVMYGNNRCGLAGCDLNRQWKAPRGAVHPTIAAAKSVMQTLPVVFYCDIHGHSRKKNVFMYGCDSRKHVNPVARTFPTLLSNHWIGRQFVSLDACNFQVHRESTARVVVGKDMGIANSFTLEASFCGADFGVLAARHFNLGHFEDIGLALGQTLAEYAVPDGMNRRTIYEWLQTDECHDLHEYIESTYNQQLADDQLGAIMPLHMTTLVLSERNGSFGRLPRKSAKAKKKKKVVPSPLPSVAVVVAKQLPSPSVALAKKPSAKLSSKKVSSNCVGSKSSSTPPPLALKKALSLPSPKIQDTRLKHHPTPS